MAINLKSGLRTGLTMAAGQVIFKLIGKYIGLNEENLKTAEYLGIGVGMGIAFAKDEKPKSVKKEKEEPESYKFRNALEQERREKTISQNIS